MKTVEKLRIAPIGTIVNFADRTLIIKRFRAIVKGKMVICRGCVFRSKGGANSCKYMTACFANIDRIVRVWCLRRWIQN